MEWILLWRLWGTEEESWKDFRNYMKKNRFLNKKKGEEMPKYNYICSRG
jgi:hypothetical protein